MDARAKTAESSKAREIDPDEMREIIADLRTLATTIEISPGSAGELARATEDRLGAIIGRSFMVETKEGTLRRQLETAEKPLVAVIDAAMTVVWYVWYGKPPADCGPKLRALADELERRFYALHPELKPAHPTAPESDTPGDGSKPAKEPAKIASQAYLLYTSMGISQEEVATKMTKLLKPTKPFKQYQVARWIREERTWRKANGLPVDDTDARRKVVPVDPRQIDAGRRTDGKIGLRKADA